MRGPAGAGGTEVRVSLPKLGCSQTQLIFFPSTLKQWRREAGPRGQAAWDGGGGGGMVDFVTGVSDPGLPGG